MLDLLPVSAFLSLPLGLWFYSNQKSKRQLEQPQQSQVNVAQLVTSLEVLPHPEGGYFIETYRSGATPMESKGLTAMDGSLLETKRDGCYRNEMTSIVFMATKDAPVLYFGINKSDHVHYYHGGGSYTYIVVHPNGEVEEVVLGGDILNGEKLQIVFPAGCYKAGYLNGEYCLIGEGVSPGFDFRDFAFVDETELRITLEKNTGDGEKLIRKYLNFVKPDRRRNFEDYYNPARKYKP